MADRQVVVELIAKTGPFSSGLGNAAQSLSGFATKAALVGTALTGLAAAGVGASINAFADFDAAMTKSTAIMGDVSAAMRQEMSDAAREVARTTKFSAEEAAESYFFLASAGLDAAKSIEALPTVARFAQAGAFDMARATDLLTDAQSALGLASDNAQTNLSNMTRVSDVLVKANTLANASVEQFSEALTNKAGASLRVLNKDVEEGAAVLAVYADQGLKGAAAGEALSIVLRDLQRAALEESAEFERLGIAVFDAEGNMRNVADIIGDVEQATAGMSDATRKATLSQLGFQERSVQQIIALLGTSDAIRQYEADLRSASGVTEEVAGKQLLTFNEQMGLLKDKITDVAIGVGESLEPELMNLVPAAEGAIAALGALAEAAGPVLTGAMGFAADAIEGVSWIGLKLAGIFDDGARTSADLIIAMRGIRDTAKEGGNTVGAMANHLDWMAEFGTLSADAIDQLAQATGRSNLAIAAGTQAVADHAREQGYAQDQISLLTEATYEHAAAAYANGDATLEEIEAALGSAVAFEVADGARRDAARAAWEQANAADDSSGALEDEADAAGETTDEITDLASALDAATDAQESLSAAVKAFADPTFAAVRAMDSLKSAEEKVAELEKDGKAGTDEWAAAMLNLAEARLDAQAGLDAFDASGITGQVEAIGIALGLSKDEVADLLESLGLLDGMTVDTVINVTEQYRQQGIQQRASSFSAKDAIEGRRGLAAGGFVSANEAVMVGEAGAEMFVPTSPGVVVPHHMLTQTAGGAQNTLNLTINNPTHAGTLQEELQAGVIMGGLLLDIEGGAGL